MSTTTSYSEQTGISVVDAMTSGYKWVLGPERVINYSVSNGFGGEKWFDPEMVSRYVGVALSTFSQFANVRFQDVGIFENPIAAAAASSDINVSVDGSNLFFDSPNSWALGLFPAPIYDNFPYFGAAGGINLNSRSEANFLPSYEPGSQGWFLLLHELGHAMGLKHPHDDGGTGRPTFSQLNLGYLDQDFVTIMTYNDDSAWNRFTWDPATPMATDVIALQYLYGSNKKTNAGNLIHEISKSGMFYTLWDASGNDTLDLSGATESWNLVLPSNNLDPTFGAIKWTPNF